MTTRSPHQTPPHRRAVTASAAAIGAFALVAAGCGSSAQEDTSERDESGAIVESGDVGVFRLDVGDCVQLPSSMTGEPSDDLTEIVGFEGVPCDEAHTGEVVLDDTQFFGSLEAFTSEDELFNEGVEPCAEAVEAYAGVDDVFAANLDVLVLVPTADSFADIDDRGLICIAVELDPADGTVLTRTASLAA